MGSRHGRWFAVLLAAFSLQQASNFLVRPWASYRALEVGMGPELLGILAAAYALAPLLIALRAGRLIDRHSEFLFAFGGASVMVAGAIAMAVLPSAPALIVSLALAGTGHVIAVIAVQSLIATRSASADYNRGFAQLSFVAAIGQLVGPAAGAIASGDGGPDGTTRALFVGAGLAFLSLGPMALAARRDPGRTEARQSEDEVRPPVREILRLPGMLPAMLSSLTVLSAVDVLGVYLPALGVERGLAVAAVGALLSVRAASSMVSRLLLGWSTARLGRERLLTVSMVASAMSLVVLPFVPLPVMFLVIIVAGFGLGVGQPLSMAWVAAGAAPGTRATALSVRIMANRLGQMAIPLAAGLAAASTGAAGVLVVTGLTVGASAAAVTQSVRTGVARLIVRR